MTKAAVDVLAERERRVEVVAWTPEFRTGNLQGLSAHFTQ
jgi:hypothetical protein